MPFFKRKRADKKVRFEPPGYDVDLEYVGKQCIAASFPHDGPGRGSLPELLRFLMDRHRGHYRVYNLCEEAAHSGLGPDARRYGFPAGGPPAPLSLALDFVSDAAAFTAENSQNVAVVHCDTGRARTGVCVSALLLATGAAASVDEALRRFSDVRGQDGPCVVVPSHLRYAGYLEKVVQHNGAAPPPRPVIIGRLSLRDPELSAGWRWSLYHNGATECGTFGLDLCAIVDTTVVGDVRLELERGGDCVKLWVHTSFVAEGEVTYEGRQLDGADDADCSFDLVVEWLEAPGTQGAEHFSPPQSPTVTLAPDSPMTDAGSQGRRVSSVFDETPLLTVQQPHRNDSHPPTPPSPSALLSPAITPRPESPGQTPRRRLHALSQRSSSPHDSSFAVSLQASSPDRAAHSPEHVDNVSHASTDRVSFAALATSMLAGEAERCERGERTESIVISRPGVTPLGIQHRGHMVTAVLQDSPAANAGIIPGHLLVSVAGKDAWRQRTSDIDLILAAARGDVTVTVAVGQRAVLLKGDMKRLRSEPRDGAQFISSRMRSGAVLERGEEKDGWVYVRSEKGVEGWLRAVHVQQFDEVAELRNRLRRARAATQHMASTLDTEAAIAADAQSRVAELQAALRAERLKAAGRSGRRSSAGGEWEKHLASLAECASLCDKIGLVCEDPHDHESDLASEALGRMQSDMGVVLRMLRAHAAAMELATSEGWQRANEELAGASWEARGGEKEQELQLVAAAETISRLNCELAAEREMPRILHTPPSGRLETPVDRVAEVSLASLPLVHSVSVTRGHDAKSYTCASLEQHLSHELLDQVLAEISDGTDLAVHEETVARLALLGEEHEAATVLGFLTETIGMFVAARQDSLSPVGFAGSDADTVVRGADLPPLYQEAEMAAEAAIRRFDFDGDGRLCAVEWHAFMTATADAPLTREATDAILAIGAEEGHYPLEKGPDTKELAAQLRTGGPDEVARVGAVLATFSGTPPCLECKWQQARWAAEGAEADTRSLITAVEARNTRHIQVAAERSKAEVIARAESANTVAATEELLGEVRMLLDAVGVRELSQGPLADLSRVLTGLGKVGSAIGVPQLQRTDDHSPPRQTGRPPPPGGLPTLGTPLRYGPAL
eukprot:TRINITY_DN26475_c0_g1_i1.p1 TRINITY_DN26475_c0_g1~~TRINITY_DN26475_c0_g1_i1.p1  ORF type:complete len:1141 (+),score=313.82 TRINITY_DN26475_c0_g1_i1:44-3424(+)